MRVMERAFSRDLWTVIGDISFADNETKCARQLENPLYPKVVNYLRSVMKRSEALQILTAHRQELAEMDVKSLAIFGSVARDEARSDSDVDVLVEFKGPATFRGYMGLKFFLEELLGSPVDLVTRKSIRPRLKSIIESEALYVQGLHSLSWG